jgi:ribosomal protein L11 methyltransferase
VKVYPALDVRAAGVDLDVDLLCAMLDDFEPTALEEREDGVRAFFAARSTRDAALGALGSRFAAAAVEVPDEDWARRSQEHLTAVQVGVITVAPPWDVPSCAASSLVAIIEPSTGFGTGHHATTRLCLRALQELAVSGRTLLDVGTGSGVLAIAAARLGARLVVGVDVDPDAIRSARENLVLNPSARTVSFEVGDLTSRQLPRADIVTANLTGSLLARSAPALIDATGGRGRLVLSGLLVDERDEVRSAFRPMALQRELQEDEWLCLVLRKL